MLEVLTLVPFVSGTDLWQLSRSSESPFEDIPPTKMVLHYEAKACYKYVCKDLTGNDPPRDGRLTGHKIYTWDIKVPHYYFFNPLPFWKLWPFPRPGSLFILFLECHRMKLFLLSFSMTKLHVGTWNYKFYKIALAIGHICTFLFAQ